MSVTQQYAPCSSMTMVPEQHLVTLKVFGSQPAGQLVSAAVEATDRIVARKRVLRIVILVWSTK